MADEDDNNDDRKHMKKLLTNKCFSDMPWENQEQDQAANQPIEIIQMHASI